MRLSDSGRTLIKGFEGYSSKAYKDADGWSIGYGHFLGRDPSLASRTISRTEADLLFDQDVLKFETAVNFITPTALQHEFDAMTSLAYNIGTGDTKNRQGGFAGSTVARLHNMGDKQGAADAFRMWKKSEGKDNPVLIARREKERAYYLGSALPPAGSFPTPPPEQSSEGWPPIAVAPSSPSSTAFKGASIASLITLALGWVVYRLVQR